jgi:hypothetical protein
VSFFTTIILRIAGRLDNWGLDGGGSQPAKFFLMVAASREIAATGNGDWHFSSRSRASATGRQCEFAIRSRQQPSTLKPVVCSAAAVT